MPRVLLVVAALALVVYAFVDCIQTSEEKVPHLPKVLWLVVISLVPPAGALAWLAVGRQRRTRRTGPRPPRPLGPDDDPDFLRGL